MWRCIASLSLGAALFSGCTAAEEADLKSRDPIEEAEAFNAGAEKCLLDVRDKKLTYETSPNCSSLGALSQSYINAGGQLPDEPPETKLVAEQGRNMAWMARAISASGDPTISLW